MTIPAHTDSRETLQTMSEITQALILIFCTPFGWIGLLCLAVVIGALRG